MFNGFLFLVFLAAGIVPGILYTKLRIKIYSGSKKREGYFPAIVMFVGASLSIFIIISIKSYVHSTIIEYSVKIEDYLNRKYSGSEIVRNGITMDQLNESLAKIQNGKDIIVSILPDENELGMGKFVYGICVKYTGGFIDTYTSKITQSMSSISNTIKAYSAYSEGNSSFTVSSIINGLRSNILKKVNQILLIILLIINIPFYIYIISTLVIKVIEIRKYEESRKNGT